MRGAATDMDLVLSVDGSVYDLDGELICGWGLTFSNPTKDWLAEFCRPIA